MVNPHLFDAKMKLRKWGGKHGRLNSVHASDTQEEALSALKNAAEAYIEDMMEAGEELPKNGVEVVEAPVVTVTV